MSTGTLISSKALRHLRIAVKPVVSRIRIGTDLTDQTLKCLQKFANLVRKQMDLIFRRDNSTSDRSNRRNRPKRDQVTISSERASQKPFVAEELHKGLQNYRERSNAITNSLESNTLEYSVWMVCLLKTLCSLPVNRNYLL